MVALDALLRTTGVTVGAVREVAAAHPGDRDRNAVEPAVASTDPRSATPSASRLRVALLGRGLPVPLAGRQLLDGQGRLVARLPLAWPDTRTAIASASGSKVAARAVGWEVVEFDRATVLDRPDDLAVRLVRLLARWDPPSLAGVAGFPLPPPPEGDGTCDGGLSRLVEA